MGRGMLVGGSHVSLTGVIRGWWLELCPFCISKVMGKTWEIIDGQWYS